MELVVFTSNNGVCVCVLIFHSSSYLLIQLIYKDFLWTARQNNKSDLGGLFANVHRQNRCCHNDVVSFIIAVWNEYIAGWLLKLRWIWFLRFLITYIRLYFYSHYGNVLPVRWSCTKLKLTSHYLLWSCGWGRRETASGLKSTRLCNIDQCYRA